MNRIFTTEITEDAAVNTSTRWFLRAPRVLRGCACSAMLLGLVIVVQSGCGYSLAGRGSFLPSYIKKVGIPLFANTTTVFNVETLLTEKVRREFIGRGKYTVFPEDTNVDAVLKGSISSIAVSPASFGSSQLASRYVITVTARIEFRELRTNTVLWENPSLVFSQDYEASAGANALDPVAFFGQEANALERIGTEFARAVVSAILEAF